MMHSFKIQKPIRDLATLRQEKQRLKQHIKTNDLLLREKVQSWPLFTLLHGAQKVGNLLFESSLSGLAGGLFGLKSSKKGFMPSLIKSALLFAGTQLVKHFAKRQHEDEDAQTNDKEDLQNTLQEDEPTAGAD